MADETEPHAPSAAVIRRARWERASTLFAEALEHTTEARVAFIQSATGDDAELRAEVLSLLRAHADADAAAFLDTPAPLGDAAALFGARATPQRVGPYRLIRMIGEGGMGTVFLAERDDATYTKQVALKVMRHGMGVGLLERRFKAERQILAQLEHPYIARFLDGGTTDDGLPYIVMEHVPGEPIGAYCDGRRLAVRERVALFVKVCEAVEYAHARLVVHRDIKPNNILVTQDGVPKLLDFGIAKLLAAQVIPGEEGAAAPTLDATESAMRLMTPEYASPEQLLGEAITTRTDVYGLGLLLYELLTGHRPHRVNATAEAEVLRAITDGQLTRPSEAAARPLTARTGTQDRVEQTPEALAARRSTTPARLSRALRGDLDTILSMALRREPDRRYATAAAFGDDLRRHLDSRPVRARPDTLRYRLHRFVRRNRAGVALGVVLFASLIAGVVTTAWQARVADEQRVRAERRFADVRRLASALIFEVHDEVAKLPGSTAVRFSLVTRALLYLDALAEEAGDDTSLLRELRVGYQRVGDVQGNSKNAHLGDYKGARTSYEKAKSIATRLIALEPAHRENRIALAEALDRMGDMEWELDNPHAAEAIYREALTLFDALLAEIPSDGATARLAERTRIDYGDTMLMLKRRPEALAAYTRALSVLEPLLRAAPNDTELTRTVSIVHVKLGDIDVQDKRDAQARERYEAARRLREGLLARSPTNAKWRRDLATVQSRLGGVQRRLGDLAAALATFERTLRSDEAVLALDPTNVQAQRDVAVSLIRLGETHDQQTKDARVGTPVKSRAATAAEREFSKALSLLEALEHEGRLPAQDKLVIAELRAALARLRSEPAR